MPLVERGVYSRPWLTAEGREVFVAVDFLSREVGCTTVEAGDNPYTALADLWDLLDLADPDHVRRVVPRPDPETVLKQDLEHVSQLRGHPYSEHELRERIDLTAAELLARGWRRTATPAPLAEAS